MFCHFEVMCFSKSWSFGFLCIGLGIATWILTGKGIWKSLELWKRQRVSAFFFYFGFMEFLQFCQYFVINECSNKINIFLTIIAWFHISMQPLISNLSFSALDSKNSNKERDVLWQFVFKMCILSGLLLSVRIVLPLFFTLSQSNQILAPCTQDIDITCSDKTCTVMGKYHLKWVFLLIRPTYVVPTGAFHFFFAFVVPLILGQHLGTLMLFLSGPFAIGLFLKDNAGEFASVWCLFSIINGIFTIGTQYYALRKSADHSSTYQIDLND